MHTPSLLRRGIAALAAPLALALGSPAVAQNAEPVVYTVGNTYNVGGGKTYAYVLWQPGDASTTYGKSFAVYRKDGPIASPDPYVKLSVQSVQTSPSAIHAMLKLGGMFDANASAAASRVNLLYAETTLQPDEVIEPAPTEPDLTVAQQLATVLDVAKGDPKVLQRLLFLGRAHPGVMIAMGHAFAIKVDPASLQTYEIREIDGAGEDVRVLGRVQLDASNPLVLAAPDRPVAVPHPTPDPRTQVLHSGKDHLACRFRWGIPVPLRRQVPHTFGYNLYRVKESVAVGLGWDNPANPPLPSEIELLIEAGAGLPDPDAKRVNFLPIIPDTVMTGPQAADLSDRETIFTHDDNDPPDNPFVSGQSFYYFVSARDIAGHPGECSPGTYVIYCDRLPPPVPTIESIDNVFTSGTADETASQRGHQHFRVRINQLPDVPEKDAAARYWIYRWTYSQEPMFVGGNPVVNRIAVVNHLPGERFLDFEDTGPGAPVISPGDESEYGITHWYTVRAEDDQDPGCAPFNLSGHSPPMWGVLRDRRGPGKAKGTLLRCRGNPVITPIGVTEGRREEFTDDPNGPGFVVRVVCEDSLVIGFDVRVNLQNTPASPDFFTTRYGRAPGQKDLFVPLSDVDGTLIQVRCRTKTGRVSEWATLSGVGPGQSTREIRIYGFRCTVRPEYTEIDLIPPTEFPPIHEFEGPGGVYVGPNGTLTIPPDAREWRVYRRTGAEGAYELIARDSGDTLPPVENWEDSAPPTVNDTKVCYFGQLFDENGNAGPLTQLGCFLFQGGSMPIPLVEDLEHLSPFGNAAVVKLKWFCDRVSVDRFEVWAAVEGTDNPGIVGDQLSDALEPNSTTVLPTEDGDLVFTPYQTPRLAGGFGNGPDFELTLLVPGSKKVYFAVRAVSSGKYGSRTEGPWSNIVSDYWQDPDEPDQAVIPWPDRPLPPLQDLGYKITNLVKKEGPFYAQKLPDHAPGAAGILVGSYIPTTQNETSHTAIMRDTRGTPLDNLFKWRNQVKDIPPAGDDLQSIAPFAVYRHQVPNAAFPDVVPNLTQVTPLIDRIAYKETVGSYAVNDPFFIFPTTAINDFGVNVPISGSFGRDPGKFGTGPWNSGLLKPPYLQGCDGLIIVLDRLPVINGATYQYLLVHFDDRGEVERVFPTNFVQQ